MIILLFLLIAIIWGIWYFSRFVKQKERKLYEFSLVTICYMFIIPLAIKFEEEHLQSIIVIGIISYLILIGKWFIDNDEHN